MNYKQTVHYAKEHGLTDDKKMWDSIEMISNHIEKLKESYPELYSELMRRQHEILFGPHYNEDFARCDVSKICFIGKDGQKHHGEHWSKEQIVDATEGMPYPNGTTDWDKYVAFNSFYADMCRDLDDATLIRCAHRYFFADDDAPDGKIWKYVQCMNE